MQLRAAQSLTPGYGTLCYKLDDGKPATGSVFSFKSTSTWTPGCTTNDLVSAEYAVTSSEKLCWVEAYLMQ